MKRRLPDTAWLRPRWYARGYTIVELIVVMVLIGIISAIAAPRLMDDGTTAAAAFSDEMISALRYAQKSAVAHRRRVCMTVSVRQVSLRIAPLATDSNCAPLLAGPIEAAFTTNDTKVSATGLAELFFQPNGTITTDFEGQNAVDGTISINLSGTSYRLIDVVGPTGYVGFR